MVIVQYKIIIDNITVGQQHEKQEAKQKEDVLLCHK